MQCGYLYRHFWRKSNVEFPLYGGHFFTFFSGGELLRGASNFPSRHLNFLEMVEIQKVNLLAKKQANFYYEIRRRSLFFFFRIIPKLLIHGTPSKSYCTFIQITKHCKLISCFSTCYRALS